MKKSFAFDIPTYSLKVKLFLVGKISGNIEPDQPTHPNDFFEVAKKHGKYKKGLENGVMRVRNVFLCEPAPNNAMAAITSQLDSW